MLHICMSQTIDIKYEWTSQIDAIELATSILNGAKILQKITREQLPKWFDVKIDVFSFREWSHITPIVLDVIQVIPQITEMEVAKSMFATAISVLPDVVTIFSDLFKLVSFLKWDKIEKMTSVDWNQVMIQNNVWSNIVVHYSTTNYYYNQTVREGMTKMLEPLKREDVTGFNLASEDWVFEPLSVSKEEVEHFEKQVWYIQENMPLIGMVYELNTWTKNGRVQFWSTKVSIWFSSIITKPDFRDLVHSLYNRVQVRIRWLVTISQSTWEYKYMEVLWVERLQWSLIPTEDDLLVEEEYDTDKDNAA